MSAQFQCGSNPSPEERAELISQYKEIVLNGHQNRSQIATIRIPVAIHFGGNVTDDYMCCLIRLSEEQIKVLNRDFQALNNQVLYHNWSNWCPIDYPISALSTGIDVEFYLATTNHPTGSGLVEGEYAITVGQEIYPNAGMEWSNYLNIFVSDIHDDDDVLGEADPMDGAQNPDGNGVWVRNTVFGAPGVWCESGVVFNTLRSNRLGRILTHEVGHYFGLLHAFEGNTCNNGDGLGDTPNQDGPTWTEPNINPSNCASTANSCGSLDFYMNHMDYTEDYVRCMFTVDQSAVMYGFAGIANWPQDNDALPLCASFSAPVLRNYDLTINCSTNPIDLDEIGVLNETPCDAIIRWSTDADPSDGVDPVISSEVSGPGIYYAYFYHTRSDCYGPASLPYTIVTAAPIVISSHEIYLQNNPPIDAIGGIEIRNNGTLEIRGGAVVFGEDAEIIVRQGGTLILSEDASLQPCFDNDFWQGITVENGGTLQNFRGGGNHFFGAYVGNAINGISALDGSTLDINDLMFYNWEARGEVAINLEGSVNLIQARNIEIYNFDKGIIADNSLFYYDFDSGIMEDVGYGFILEKSPSRIVDYNISAEQNGIHLLQSGGSHVERCTIETGISNPNPAGTYGIYTRSSNATRLLANTIGSLKNPTYDGIWVRYSRGCLVEDNVIISSNLGIGVGFYDITINENNITCLPGSRGGILVGIGRGGDYRQIKNNYIDAADSQFGIENIYCREYEIENNEIVGALSNKGGFGAILLDGCRNEIIKSNDIHGLESSIGISVQNSTGNTFDCNHVDGGSEGLGIFHNSLGQTIRGNELNSAVDLAIRSVTGQQVHHGNKFIGGKADASTLSPSELQNSQFFVNDIFPNFMPTNPNPASDWFISEPEVAQHFVCGGTVGPNQTPFWDDEEAFCSYYKYIVEEYGTDSDEYVRMLFTIERHYSGQEDAQRFSCMEENPLQKCIQQLVNIENSLMDISSMDVQELVDQVSKLRAMLDEGGDATEIAETIAKINQINAEFIQQEQNALEALDQSASELQELDCSKHPIFLASRDILIDLISFLQTESSDNFDFSKSLAYSQYCADDYGASIHLARFIASHATEESFEVIDDCRNKSTEFKLVKDVKEMAILYPNPSSGIINIQFDKKTNCTIKVHNAQGHTIDVVKISDKMDVSLDLRESHGLNFIRITRENGESEILKTMIIK